MLVVVQDTAHRALVGASGPFIRTARGPAVALLLCVVPNLSVRIIARNNSAVKPDRICECVDYLGTGGTLESIALDPNKIFALTADTSDPAARALYRL